MADVTADGMAGGSAPGRKRRFLGLFLGVALASAFGGAGFVAARMNLIPLPGSAARVADPSESIAFVPVDPLIVSLAPGAQASHLRMTAQIEVDKAHAAEVAALMPRILDVLNGYLRAVDTADIESAAALVRIRAQMLRRIQIVTGEGRVRDFLVTEFVLN